mgnify:FL=1
MQSYSFATWIANIFVFTFSVNRLFNTGFLLQIIERNHPRNVGATGRVARYTCRRAVVLNEWEWWKGGNGWNGRIGNRRDWDGFGRALLDRATRPVAPTLIYYWTL